jgi:DNA-binding NarL/FixJ family response regulator
MRVLVVSDNLLARAALEALVAGVTGLEFAGAVDRAAASANADEHEADAVIFDAANGDAELISWVEDTARGLPGLAMIGVGAAQGDGLKLVAAGATAVLPADAAPPILLAALEAAAISVVLIDRVDLDAILSGDDAGGTSAELPVEQLTRREMEVLQLLARGMTNPRIAHALEISEHTVKFHVTAIMGKLGASTRAEAVARASRLGWLLV